MTTRRQKNLNFFFVRAEAGSSSTRRDVTCCQGQIVRYKGDTGRHDPQKGRAISIIIARSVPPSHRLRRRVGDLEGRAADEALRQRGLDPEGRDADEALIGVLCSEGQGRFVQQGVEADRRGSPRKL
jgi:hypothetical protein